MFSCDVCGLKSQSLRAYNLHLQFHRNVAGFSFPCKYPNCGHYFRTYSSFKSHIRRNHKNQQKKPHVLKDGVICVRSVFCGQTCKEQTCEDRTNLQESSTYESSRLAQSDCSTQISIDPEQFLHSLAQFYLKLASKASVASINHPVHHRRIFNCP